MRFLGLDFEDTVPDAKTLWLFRDTLANKNAIDKLFRKFNRYLDEEGLFARQGQLIDASIVPVSVERTHAKKIPASNKVKSREYGKSNRTRFNRKIPMRVG
jgi:IS5 family transposase